MIKGFGSVDALELQVNNELCPAIQIDSETISENLKNAQQQDTTSKPAQATETQQSGFDTNVAAAGYAALLASGATNSIVGTANNKEEQVNELETPKVKLAFGI